MRCLILSRLNFAHCLAEEPSMKRFDSFLALNIILVLVLSYTFFYASNSLNYFENNPILKAKFERSKDLQILKKELNELAAANKPNSRQVASINPIEKTEVVNSIGHSSPDVSELARKYFAAAKQSCYQPQQEMECLNNIDVVISQFPESIWAGESLVLLTELYQKNNKEKQAEDLLKILKSDFKSYPSVQVKVNYLEKKVL